MQLAPPTDINFSASGKGMAPCEESPSVGCMRDLFMPCSLCLQDPGEADRQGEGQGKTQFGEGGETLSAAGQGAG